MPNPRAINAGGARVRLTLYDDLQKGLRRAEYKLRAFGKRIGSMGQSLGRISALILAPLAIGGKVFADFETQMAKVATMLDEPQKHMAKFRTGLQQMAVEFGQSTAALADGLYDILSATIPPERALELLRAGTKAAVGGFTDAKTSISALITIMQAYDSELKNASDASDFLFSVVKRGRLDYAALAANLGKVAPVAAATGVKLEEFGAALALVTRGMPDTERATTSLANIIETFLKNTDDAVAIADKLGIEMSSAGIKAKGLLYVIQKLSQVEPDLVAKIFPRRRALRGLIIAVRKAKELGVDIDVIADRAGRADEAYQKVAQTLTQRFKQAWQAILAFFEEIGAAVAGPLKNFFVWLTETLGMLKQWASENHGLIQSVGKLGLVLGGIAIGLMTLGAAIQGVAFVLGGLTMALTVAKVSAIAFAGVITALASPIGVLALGFAGLGVAVLASSEEGRQAFGNFGSTVKQTIRGISDALHAGDISAAMTVLWEGIKAIWADGVYALKNLWINMKENFQTNIFSMLEIIQDFFLGPNSLVGWAEKAINYVLDKLTQLGDKFQELREFYDESVGPSKIIARDAEGNLVLNEQEGPAKPRAPANAPSYLDIVKADAERARKDAAKAREEARTGFVAATTKAMAQRMASQADTEWDKGISDFLGSFSKRPIGAGATPDTDIDLDGLNQAISGIETAGFFRLAEPGGIGAGTSVAREQLDVLKNISKSSKDIEENTRDSTLTWG